MPLIECKLGQAETNVAGHTYCFNKDKHGRYVAVVHNIDHMAILLSVDPYQVVEEEPEQTKPKKARAKAVVVPDPALPADPAIVAGSEPAPAETASETAGDEAGEDGSAGDDDETEGDAGSEDGTGDEPADIEDELTEDAGGEDGSAGDDAEIEDEQTEDEKKAAAYLAETEAADEQARKEKLAYDLQKEQEANQPVPPPRRRGRRRK